MKRVSGFCFSFSFSFSMAAFWLLAAIGLSTLAGAQSQVPLGDYARAVKKAQPGKAQAKVVYTNDNLPNGGSLSVVGKTPDPDADQSKDQDKDKDKDADSSKDGQGTDKDKDKDKDALKPGQTPAEHDKALAALKVKLDEQKSKVDLLTRELAVLQGEYKLKETAFVNNPQQRVQNPSGFDVEAAKYTQQIADKQKDLDAAKASLTAMQDDARKAGAPNSAVE
jgi:hypothetical protein